MRRSETVIGASFERGLALHKEGRLEAAALAYEEVLRGDPDHFHALHLLGLIAWQTQRAGRAVELFDRALKSASPGESAPTAPDQPVVLKSDYAAAYYNRGKALCALKRYEEALASFSQAIALRPDHVQALNSRGHALRELKRHEEAIESYDRALAIKPDAAEVHNNRGNALRELNRYQAAVESYDRAIALNPGIADAHKNRGDALRLAGHLDLALESYDAVMSIQPCTNWVRGIRLYTRMQLCAWGGFAGEVAELARGIEAGEAASPPFALLTLLDSPGLQQRAAQVWVREEFADPGVMADRRAPALEVPAAARWDFKAARGDRIRVGYFSGDFYNHATSLLMAGLFELHDQSAFEFTAFSFGPNTQDALRARVQGAFEHFLEVGPLSDFKVAQLARQLQIDIAVDLGGFTQDGRPGIFAQRAAPLQVSYLGYPGTLGAPFMDYLIADEVLIPKGGEGHYSEKIIYLPGSYQVNDAKREIAPRRFKREDLGLPGQGFVYCCFNNNYKITPAMFDVWMRILQRVEGSVLWLLEDNAEAARNLREEARRRGVEEGRLIFAPRLPQGEHLARHYLADLFLDTLPYNAHTTASDALWAGLPVLTCMGEGFAARVAGSLLTAVDLPELITRSISEYEELAVNLALDARRLAQIKERLARNRHTSALFDTPRFTRHLEAAYTQIHARYQAGLPTAPTFPARFMRLPSAASALT